MLNSKFCHWYEDGDNEFKDIWRTDCNKEYEFTGSCPTNYGMKFCCFCGRTLLEVMYKQKEHHAN
jgi:hypothetical protein